jgi:15-cis-phytoene synthase
MAESDPAPIAQFLKDADRDRYYASLVLKPEVLPHAQALYGFNAEIASVRERVSEPGPGEIRLQWWNDALEGQEHGAVRGNPVARALLEALSLYGLPRVPLQRLIAARRFDLYQDPMPDTQSFEGYAGETASVLYHYTSMMLNEGQPVEPGDAAGHLGVAHAYVGHLAAFGFNASRGQIFLPWSVFEAAGVREGEIFSGTVSEGLLAALAQFYDAAREHLAQAEAAIGTLERKLRPAFALLPVLKGDLQRLERANATPFARPALAPEWQRIAIMTWWTWRNG